jgi:putative redox protein
VNLEWRGEQRLAVHADGAEIVLDGAGRAGPTPVQTLGSALAGCMAIDLVHILTKGRFPVRGLRVTLSADRAAEEPRRFERVRLRFEIDTDAPADRIERALALSREKYCSVWHSMRTDIDLDVMYERVNARPD